MLLYVHRNHRFIRDGAGTEIQLSPDEVLARTKILGTGRRRISRLYLTLYCHHQNDSCVKTVSDDSHVNVSFILKDEVTKDRVYLQLQTTNIEEPKQNRTQVIPLTSPAPYR